MQRILLICLIFLFALSALLLEIALEPASRITAPIRLSSPVAEAAVLNIVVQLGSEEKVFDWSRDRCEQEHIPDIPANAFVDENGKVQLIASSDVNYRMIGNTLNTVVPDCRKIFEPPPQDPDPSKYTGHQWLSDIYAKDGHTVFGIIHNEFHGHRVGGDLCPSGEYKKCWFNSINLAISRDAGQTYTQKPGTEHLVAAWPYKYRGGDGYPLEEPHGYFSPVGIEKGGYYYVFFRSLPNFRSQPSGTCLMRAPLDSLDWKMWDGSGFNVAPINPYRDGEGAAVCTPVNIGIRSGYVQSVTWNDYLKKYVLVGPGYEAKSGYGFYYSLSDDLITWVGDRMLFATCTNDSCTPTDGYPSLLDPLSSDRNFAVGGRTTHLYFSRNYKDAASGYWDRDLIRRSVIFTQPPITPQNLSATAIDAGRISLAWANLVDEDAFEIERSMAGGAFSFIATTSPDTVSYTDSGLNPATNYTYRIRAHNIAGYSSHSTEAGADTSPLSLPGIFINNLSRSEGNSGTTNFAFTVTLSGGVDSPVSVDYETVDGSARAGSDYILTSGRVAFSSSQTSQTITVLVNGDAAVEPNETFLVKLSNPVNAVIADGEGLGTIVNDDSSSVRCGNGVMESGEECDGSDFGQYGNGANQCSAYDSQFASGNLLCTGGCAVDTSQCVSGGGAGVGGGDGGSGDATLSAPSQLTARAVSANKIALTWKDNSSDEEGFEIEQSSDGVKFSLALSTSQNFTQFTVGGLRPATSYFFRARAFRGSSVSAFSNVVSATTLEISEEPIPPPSPIPGPAPSPAPEPTPAPESPTLEFPASEPSFPPTGGPEAPLSPFFSLRFGLAMIMVMVGALMTIFLFRILK